MNTFERLIVCASEVAKLFGMLNEATIVGSSFWIQRWHRRRPAAIQGGFAPAVRSARSYLATAGYTALRYDTRGMGDSAGARRSFGIEAAMGPLQAARVALRGEVAA